MYLNPVTRRDPSHSSREVGTLINSLRAAWVNHPVVQESPGGREPPKPRFWKRKSSGPVTYHGRKGKDNITNSTTSSSKDQIPLFWEEWFRTQMKIDVMRVKAHWKL